MNKIPREAKAFAQRVKMSQKRLWILVEGRDHDSPFYDRLLASHDSVRDLGYSVRLGEQIELNGKCAGGKTFVRELFSYFESEDLLTQTTKNGPRQIAFALDRDLDQLSGNLVDSDYVFYTDTVDVEAEILINGDLPRAVSSAYSITRETADAIFPSGVELASSLARLWRQWITFGVVAVYCDIRDGLRYGRKSEIHKNLYGDIDETKFTAIAKRLETRLATEGKIDSKNAAEAIVDRFYATRTEWRLVKGKWMVNYVYFLARTELEGPAPSKTLQDSLAKTCLETVNFSGSWAERYRRQLDRLLAS